jgi:pimeloyl-ACP methyl ester carboxylesterase
LGYQRYLAHGGDWGSIIATRLGHEHADHCAGIHLTMVSARLVAAHAATEEDKAWLSSFMARFEDDGGYFRLQSTRPQTIGYALQDSPVGFAAWLVEKYAAWADVARDAVGRPDLFSAISRDELLTSIMLFLATDSVATSTWIYRGFARENPAALPPGERVNVPVAVTAFADKAFPITPRGLFEKVYNAVDWSVKDKGGHFPALEVPDLLAAELRRFVKNYAQAAKEAVHQTLAAAVQGAPLGEDRYNLGRAATGARETDSKVRMIVAGNAT